MSRDFLNLLERLVRAGVDFVIVGGFAGVLDYGKIALIPRMILKLYLVILRVKEGVRVKEGDYRDWDAIKSWVQSLNFR